MDPQARPILREVPAYVSGRRHAAGVPCDVLLASNENPLGPSPLALEALERARLGWARYPEDDCADLRQALADRLGVPPACVAVGAGSTALLKLLAEAYLDRHRLLVCAWPSFPYYPVVAQLQEARTVSVPLDGQGRHDLPRMADHAAAASVVVVCNPNNPTGTYVSKAELEAFLDRLPDQVLVVVDEAYGEFARAAAADYPDGVRWVREGRRVAVLRTFSKVYGLAGLRVGYLVAPAEVVEAVRRVQEPFQVSSPAQAAALAALEDSEHVARTLQVVAEGRQRLHQLARQLGLGTYPSVANFVWMDVRRPAEQLAAQLMRHGVLVRPGPPGTTWVRVSVGTPEEIGRFEDALRAALGASG
ncbi:MAG: histidinol-phosphate transaminase [Armatimonadota bacterium]|nr:histidinol-phosphate transaminase [Armatimonadota bacterium]MDW8155490.1 histidinol-phosphate transaminase [Armatimonadota bacterium]